MPPATQVQGDCIGEARLDENTNGTPVLAKLGHLSGRLFQAQLIEWNGYETRQTPLLYVFVDLKVHNVQKNSYHFDCIDQ